MAAKPKPRGHLGGGERHPAMKHKPHGVAKDHATPDVQGGHVRGRAVKPAPLSRRDKQD